MPSCLIYTFSALKFISSLFHLSYWKHGAQTPDPWLKSDHGDALSCEQRHSLGLSEAEECNDESMEQNTRIKLQAGALRTGNKQGKMFAAAEWGQSLPFQQATGPQDETKLDFITCDLVHRTFHSGSRLCVKQWQRGTCYFT